MSVKITIEGVQKAKTFLNLKNVKTHLMINKAMVKAGTHMDKEVKSSIAGQRAEPTSVDTGNFLRSVTFKSFSDSAVIYSDVSYAEFLEYGTSRINARRHFNNSKNRNKQKIAKIIHDEVKKI